MVDTLWLFVYGSLKTGECNYDRVARYVRGARPARVYGNLYLRGDGYPALTTRFGGSSDGARDLALAGGPAGIVSGELLELGSGLRALRELDAFEGFEPGREAASEYLRELVPLVGEGFLAWVYVCARPDPAWPAIESWPPPGHPAPKPYTGGSG